MRFVNGIEIRKKQPKPMLTSAIMVVSTLTADLRGSRLKNRRVVKRLASHVSSLSMSGSACL